MKNKKLLLICSIIFFSITLCVSSVYIGYTAINGDVFAESAIKDNDEIRLSNVFVCNVAVPDIYPDTMLKIQVGNLDSRMSLADKMRMSTDAKPDGTKEKTNSKGITKYTFNGEVVRIDIPSGINRLECNRSYYFSNGHLYMADFSVGATHEKMYFSEDIMYRYKKQDLSVKSNDFSDVTYCYIGNFAINEAKAFYK